MSAMLCVNLTAAGLFHPLSLLALQLAMVIGSDPQNSGHEIQLTLSSNRSPHPVRPARPSLLPHLHLLRHWQRHGQHLIINTRPRLAITPSDAHRRLRRPLHPRFHPHPLSRA